MIRRWAAFCYPPLLSISRQNAIKRYVLCFSSKLTPKDFAFMEENEKVEQSRTSEYPAEAILISKSIGFTSNEFDVNTHKLLRQFRGKLNETLVVGVLKLAKSPEIAVKFFIWAGRQIGYSHSSNTYDALLDVLGFDKTSQVDKTFLKEIGEDDREVLGKLLNVLIRKCCKYGFWNQALAELGRLKDFGHKASKVTYNALVQALLSADRLDSAFLVHREMLDIGYSMDRFTMGCFAKALCKVERWGEAINLIESEDFVLDTVICTHMISGLLEASLFEEAMSFLHRMRSNSCVPNVVTYRTLLSGFLKKKQLGWCKRIINMMMVEGCYPNMSLFNSLMHAYCVSQDFEYAYKLLKKMKTCGCNPGYVTYNIFIGGICGNEKLPSLKLLKLAEQSFDEMLNDGIMLNKINVINFARCLCEFGKFDGAFEIIKETMKKGFIPDNSTYSKVISILCQSQKMEHAFLLFKEMKNNGLTPDVYTYTILIDKFCKVGLIKQATVWFSEMVRDGCVPNVVTYTALMHGYLKAKKVNVANDLFDQMIKNGCFPSVVTYTALIDGLCKAGHVERACQIYTKMKGTCDSSDVDKYFESSETDTTEPNVFTYGALIDGLCKAHKVTEANELVELMLSEGCEPNHVVYDALIDGFCKAGKVDDAEKLFTRMSKQGLTPSVCTYSALLDKFFKDGNFDGAKKILRTMLENSCYPNVITYTEMIDGLFKLGKSDEAYKLFIMMEEKGCKPNVVTFTAIIDGFGKLGKVDICLKLFNQMVTKGCAPNFITYRVLINHCCQAGLLDEAHQLLEEMKQTYWPRHVAGYHNVIQGFNRNFLLSLGLLEEIAEYGSVPIAPAYKILIDCSSKAGRLDKALELHREITSSLSCSSNISRDMFSSLIESLCLASKIDKGFELFTEMICRGYVPEITLLFCIIKGLLRANKWDEALQICHCLHHMGINWVTEDKSDGS